MPVCAIGASGDGLSALQRLLQALPDDLGLAYIVPVPPEAADALVAQLSASTAMPISHVGKPRALQPDCVYLVAQGSALVIADDSIAAQGVTAPQPGQGPIDSVFGAIAANRNDALAVVLAGSDADGATGLRAIAAAGGTVLVQDPAEADNPARPRAAIATGVASVIAPLGKLAAQIAGLARSKAALRSATDLRAIIADLQGQLESTAIAHSDMQNLIAATDIGTLFLDTQLRIRMFTPAVAELFAITDSDTGRRITEFSNRLIYDELENDAGKVLRDLVPVETEVEGRNGKWFIIRLRPYRTIDNQIEGVVLTFVDISTRRRIEKDLRESQQNYQVLFDSIDEGFAIIKVIFEDDIPVDYRFIKVNVAFERQTGLADAQGRSAVELVPDIEQHWPQRYGQVAITGKAERFEAPSDVMGRYFDVYAFPIGLKGEQLVGILFRDVTERKEAEHQRQMLTNELSHRVKNTLAVVQALARQPGSAQMTVEQYRDRFVGRIQALGHAHDQLLETHWNSADLETLARKALSPYGGQGRRALDISGPQVLLTPKQGLGLALVLHELATNASKYGALSTEDGALSLTWRIAAGEDGPRVNLVWQETGGPKVEGMVSAGFGTRLITQACTYELDGTVELSPCETGYIAKISFPMDRIRHG